MKQFNKLFINLTWACNLDCPRCYIPKKLRDDYTSSLDKDYFAQVLAHKSIDPSHNTIAIYMGGEPSVMGEGGLRSYINIVSSILPRARHTIVTNLFNLPKWLVAISLNEFSSQIETTYANGKKQTLYGNEYKYQEKFVKNLTLVSEAGINCTVNVELNIETIKAGTEAIISIMKHSGAKDWAFDYSVNFDDFNNNPVFDSFHYPVLTGNATLKEYWGFVNAIKADDWVVNNNIRIAPRVDGFNTLEGDNFLTINPNCTVTTNPLFSTITALQHRHVDELNNSKIKEQHQKRAVNRIRHCVEFACNEFDDCQGFSAHIPIQQDGFCAGGLAL